MDAVEPIQSRGAATAAAVPQASRHVTRDYSYVLAELKHIALVIAIVVAGLIAVTAALRWF